MKKKILIGFCALFILLLIGGYIFLRSDFFLGRLRVVAESVIKKQLALETSIGSITGNIFKGIKVSDVSITSTNKNIYNKIAEVEGIDISYSLPSLLRWKFKIHKINVNSPKIWLERDKYGKFNLTLLNAEPKPEPKYIEKQKKKSRFSVLIDELNLSSGEIAFFDEISQINSSISQINLKLNGKGSQEDFSGKFDAKQMDIKQKNISKVAYNLSSSFEIKPNIIDISEFNMQMGKSILKVYANIQNGENSNLDARVQSSLFLDDVKEFVPQLKRLDGFGDINAEIRGELDNLIGNLNINLPIAHVNNLEIKDIIAKAEFTQNNVDLKDLTVNIGNSTTKATGNIQITEGKLREYKGLVNLRNLDVNRTINDLNETKTPISGYLDAQVAFDGTGFQLDQVNLDAKCFMTNTIYRNETNQAFTVGDINADISIKDKALKMDLFRNKMKLDIEGQMNEEGKITLAMSADGFDLEELKSFFADVPPTQGKVNIDAKASMT
ncbi:AsmA family protein, partial [Candidatus Poribacteria bacterium]|nr:AsmA family protein [Candidatus Poribacteria bacterium]